MPGVTKTPGGCRARAGGLEAEKAEEDGDEGEDEVAGVEAGGVGVVEKTEEIQGANGRITMLGGVIPTRGLMPVLGSGWLIPGVWVLSRVNIIKCFVYPN